MGNVNVSTKADQSKRKGIFKEAHYLQLLLVSLARTAIGNQNQKSLRL